MTWTPELAAALRAPGAWLSSQRGPDACADVAAPQRLGPRDLRGGEPHGDQPGLLVGRQAWSAARALVRLRVGGHGRECGGPRSRPDKRCA